MQFISTVVGASLRKAPVVIKGLSREGMKRAPVLFRPPAQYMRGLVTGKVKYTPIAGTQGARTATITPFLRAGIQTRQITAYVVKTAVVRGPVTAVNVFKAAARITIRDAVITPMQVPLNSYQALRAMRAMSGASSRAERAVDAFIPVVGRYLGRFGLEPRVSGYIYTPLRGALYATIYRGLEGLDDRRRALESYVSATIDNYKTLDARLRGMLPPPVVAPVPVGVEPIGVAPVLPAPTPPSAPLPSPPARPTTPRGAPIIYTPPVRR